MKFRSLLQAPFSNVHIADVPVTTTVGDYTEYLTVTNTDRGIMTLLVTMNINVSTAVSCSRIWFINKRYLLGAGWQTVVPLYDSSTALKLNLQVYADTANTFRLRIIRAASATAATARMRVESFSDWQSVSFTDTAVNGNDVTAYSEYVDSYMSKLAIGGYTADRVPFGSAAGVLTDSNFLKWNGKTLTVSDGALTNTSIGSGAGANWTGQFNLSFGEGAGANGVAVDSGVYIGSDAGGSIADASDYCVLIGESAGQYISSPYNTAIGYQAMRNANLKSMGSYQVAIGYQVATNAAASINSIHIGRTASFYGVGVQTVNIGYQAGYYAKGDSAVRIGDTAGKFSIGNSGVYIGDAAGLYTPNGTDNIFIGRAIGTLAGVINTADFLNFNSANVNITTNRVTITAHGKTVGKYYLVRYTKDAGGTVPAGLVTNSAYMVYVVDANTLEFEVDITTAGTGTAHFLYFAYTYTNTIIIGNSQAGPTASNQILLGNSSSVELSTAAYFRSTSTKANFMPVGTTAQRPAAGVGQYRWNSTTGKPEFHNGTTWIDFIMSDVYTAGTSPWTVSGVHIYNNNLGNVGIDNTNTAFTPSDRLHIKSGNLRVEAGNVAIGSTVISTTRLLVNESTVGNRAFGVICPANTTAAVKILSSNGSDEYIQINSTTGAHLVSIGNATIAARVLLNHRVEIKSSGNTATDFPLIITDSGGNELTKHDAVGGMIRTGEDQIYFQSAKIFGGGGSSNEMQVRQNAVVIDVDASANSHIHVEFNMTLTGVTHQLMIHLIGVMAAGTADVPVVCDIKSAQGFDSGGLVGAVSTVSANAGHTITWYKSSNNKPAFKITNTAADIGWTQLRLDVLRGAFVSSSSNTAPAVAQVVINTGTNI